MSFTPAYRVVATDTDTNKFWVACNMPSASAVNAVDMDVNGIPTKFSDGIGFIVPTDCTLVKMYCTSMVSVYTASGTESIKVSKNGTVVLTATSSTISAIGNYNWSTTGSVSFAAGDKIYCADALSLLANFTRRSAAVMEFSVTVV
ncbi:MAG: hypothetical protein D6694_12795 [Gammaproteobacteria bacterium]|nr:MAG: hypothetical protein D6694_12795 [Gammaproteobacteria bacterium]